MYTKIPQEEQTQHSVVYESGKDYFQVLHQICVDLNEASDQSLKQNWGIPYKDLKNCRVKTHSNGRVELLVFELHGGFRVPQCDNKQLQDRAKETKKLLKEFENALKKEFKKRTGKTFKLNDVKENCNYELVATNGLYRFWANKNGYLATNTDGQEYKERLGE